jgi:hypothetical protein
MLWHAIEGIVPLGGSALETSISVANVLVSKTLAMIQTLHPLRDIMLVVSISATNVLVPSQSINRQ